MTSAPTIVTGLSSSKLALEGGKPLRTRPFAGWPDFSQEQIDIVTQVLRSGKVNYWTGDECRCFEREYAAYVGTKHAIALSNGTVALELALLALGVGVGDEVITSCRTFIASASCASVRGAVPVLADVDPESGNITADSIRQKITSRTKAIIVVHLAGWPCDMDSIMEAAHEHGLKVIEDCAQAHGATYKGRPVGSFGVFNAFSFCQDKIISTGGEGGMVTTNDTELWERAWAYKDHGKSYRTVYQDKQPPGFRWVHESFGTNWRMTEIQGTLGRLQLRDLERSVCIRRRNATILDVEFSNVPALRTAKPPQSIAHSYYKYYVYLRPELLTPEWSRDKILEAINAEGVPCFAGSCSELYLEKAFLASSRPSHSLPNAQLLGKTSLTFLVHPTLSEIDMKDVAEAVKKVLAVATLQ